MFHKTFRFSLLALVLAGLLLPAAQALAAEPQLPADRVTFRCEFKFRDGTQGTFDNNYPVAWTPRQVPPPNKLWSGQVQNDSNPPVGVDLAWKPGELQFLEITIPSQGKQCKKFAVTKAELLTSCWEANSAENCSGGGLENLLYQRCTAHYPGSCR